MSKPGKCRNHAAEARSRFSRTVCQFLAGFAVVATLAADAAAQTVENVVATLDADNKTAVITYDLHSASSEEMYISLYYSVDDGATFAPAPANLSGNIGPHVSDGVAKSIRWENFSTNLHEHRGRNAIFRVAARAGEDDYIIQFTDAMTTVSEGRKVASLQIQASKPFYGTVRYTLSDLTNVNMAPALNPDIAPLSGAVQMAGTSAEITVPLIEDFEIEDAKALTLDLVYDESLGYKPGKQFRTMLVLYDDDAYWNGVLRGTGDSEGEMPFRLALTQNDGELSATLICDNSGVVSSNAFPPGAWPLTASWDGTVFSAQSANIPVPESLVFPTASSLHRRLSLLADTQVAGALVQMDKLVMGYSVDEFIGNGESAYLSTASPAGFLMMREIVPFTPPEPMILPIPSALPNSSGKLATDAVLEIKEAQL